MMNESLDIILKLYREEGPVSYEGEYWTIKEMEVQVKPYQQPHLPIYMVSSGSGNSIRVAAERGLGVISGVYSQPNALNISPAMADLCGPGNSGRARGQPAGVAPPLPTSTSLSPWRKP